MRNRLSAVIISITIALLSLTACHVHTLERVEGRAPTCTEGGVLAHYVCTGCGNLFLDESAKEPLADKDLEIPKTGHTYGEFRYSEAFNCLTGGEMVRTCETCGDTDRKSVPATGAHAWNNRNVCSVCGFTCRESEGLSYELIIENGREAGYSVALEGTAGTSLVLPPYHNELPVLELRENAFSGCESLRGAVIYSPLRKIGASAFANCIDLRELVLPSSLTEIGEGAFRACASLKGISLPDGVLSLGKNAFYGCSALETLRVGAGLTEIGRSAFMGCGALETITVSGENTHYYAEGNCLIERETGLLIRGGNRSAIPEGVKTIGEFAFNMCEGLVKLTLPSSLKEIGNFAFRDCVLLEHLDFNGTETEWEAVKKGTGWADNVSPSFSVGFLKH